MKILFVMRHSGYVRNFESTLRMLCDRGHDVHLAFQGAVKYAQLDPTDIAQQLAEQYSTFSYGQIPLRTDGWGLVGRELRLGMDYLRYLSPAYARAPKLRERARREAPPRVIERTDRNRLQGNAARWAYTGWLRAMDQAIPRDPEIDAFLSAMRPDVLAVTPLIEPGSPQAEYVRSARALGIPAVYCVASWDNLSNKGLIHGAIDLVTVWNETMRREAIEMHGMSPRRVVVTGAAAFDHWFGWRPSTGREAFCSRVGLPLDRPYLLYVCSSKFVAPEEAAFVRTWAQQIRQSSSPTVRNAGILVRPHPQNADQWRSTDVSDLGIAVWPPAGAAPVDVASRSDYFDSIFHSAAVVGVNTTAQIECAILDRPVFTVLAPEFKDTQDGTLHFDHLRRAGGGLLHVASDFAEHVAQIDGALRQQPDAHERNQRFVEAFVRPFGREVPATPKLVDALETIGATPRHVRRDPVWAPLVRPWLARRGAQLEEEARTQPDSYGAKLIAKAAREKKRRVREAERRARLAEKATRERERERQRLEQLAQRAEAELVVRNDKVHTMATDFRQLGEVDRRNVLHEIVDCIPPDSFIDLHAATRPRKLDYEHADIYMRVTTKGELVRLRGCAKEPFTVDWIHRRIGKGDVLYDIGANVGVYSLVAAKKPNGGARVFAFEASYATVGSLCANIVLNDLASQITPLPIALSDATAMNVFSLRDLRAGAARHALGYDAPEDGPTLYQQPVLMFTLDDVIELFRLPQPNHIKLDVDGGELAVLHGAARTLASPLLKSMLVEVSTAQSGMVTELLGRYGLGLDSKIGVTNKAGEHAVWYGLFTREAAATVSAAAAAESAQIQR
jgi:FkbM family methyltransferase